MNPLCKANIDVLLQLKDLIYHTRDIYHLDVSGKNSSVGRHVRHVLDHYYAFSAGVGLASINYNTRNRNSEEESNYFAALEKIDDISNFLSGLKVNNKEIEVISEVSVSHEQTLTTNSSAERELLYLINHTIHHMAYVSLLAKTQGVLVPRNIGLSPATATYEKETIGA